MFTELHKTFDTFTERERAIFKGAALVFSVSLILNSANIFYKSTELAPVEGGIYTEGVVGQPIALNPLIAGANEADKDITKLLFSDLTDLMETHTISADNRTWTITLKENLTWSDGNKLTSDDIIFTLETVQDPEAHSPQFATWQGVNAERLSEREVRFILKTPYAFFLDNLSNFQIAPQHIFGSIPSANLRLSDYNLEPVGSGPYKFEEYIKGKDGFITEYKFAVNPNYADRSPLIKEIRIKFFPSYDAAIQGFNRREIDGLGGLRAQDVSEIKVGYQLKELIVPRYYAVFLNQNTSLQLRDDAVREALALATNRDTIVKDVFEKRAIPVYGPIYPGIEGYESDVADAYPFSLEKAAELLEKGGWVKGAEGIRTKIVQGSELSLSFELVVPDIDFLVETAEILKKDWAEIGVVITPIVLSTQEIAQNAIRTRNYQMLIFGNILKNNPDVFSFWHSTERFRPGLNLSLYENSKVDSILEAIRKNFNPESRITEVKSLQTMITNDIPAVFLFAPNYLYAAPRQLGGFSASAIPTPSDRFEHVSEWYLKTARVFNLQSQE
ncbi:MAG: peptide ABC transporter substrate-binding protein [Patescibacteria group bacterium]